MRFPIPEEWLLKAVSGDNKVRENLGLYFSFGLNARVVFVRRLYKIQRQKKYKVA